MPTKRKPRKDSTYPWVSFRPTPLLISRLNALSERTGQSVSSLVREALASGLPAMETAAKKEVAS